MKMINGKRALDKVYKRRNRYEVPDWQREEVWNKNKKQNLIDSILKGWKLPKFYFLKTSENPEEFEVVDGQQRLLSIFEFFENDLLLSDESSKQYGASSYKDLPDKLSDHFDDFEIEFDIIEDATDEEVKEFFQRLQDGLPLTSSEKLNSIHSKLRDYTSSKSSHSFFDKVTASNKRYGFFDIVAKVAAIEIEGIETGLRYDDLREIFKSQANFSSKSKVAQNINDTLDFLNEVFQQPEPYLRNRSITQSLITLALPLVRSKKTKGLEGNLKNFFINFMKELAKQVELGHKATDKDYIDFQRTINANTRYGAQIRHNILLTKLFVSDSELTRILGHEPVLNGTIEKIIKDESEKIINLVSKINEVYSTSNGKDLFKATNKTVRAQNNLKKQIKDYDEYKNLVDEMYFLFCESTGQRINSSDTPQSFKDIKILRTDLEHDIDHGTNNDTKRKKIQIGETFKKYSGEKSPLTLAPHLFPIVHSKLLSAIRIDLEELKSKT